MSLDAPDWERILVTVEAMGDVPDAPDWQRIAVGPGGTPVTSPAVSSYSIYQFQGFKALAFDPFISTSGRQPSSGAVLFQACTALTSGTIHNIWGYIVTTRSVTANENFVGLYDYGQTTASTFTLLGSSTAGVLDPKVNTGGSGMVECPLSAGVTVTAGNPYALAWLMNSAGTPSLASCTTVDLHMFQPLALAGPVAAQTTATSFTTMPSSVAWSALTAESTAWWMAAS